MLTLALTLDVAVADAEGVGRRQCVLPVNPRKRTLARVGVTVPLWHIGRCAELQICIHNALSHVRCSHVSLCHCEVSISIRRSSLGSGGDTFAPLHTNSEGALSEAREHTVATAPHMLAQKYFEHFYSTAVELEFEAVPLLLNYPVRQSTPT